MNPSRFQYDLNAPIAFMGGVYGNVPALRACLADARTQGCGLYVFLGDAIGCCGHSDEALELIRDHFDITLAGNLEQEAAAGSDACACGYGDPEDEKYGCLAQQYALNSLGEPMRAEIAAWPSQMLLETRFGTVVLCHGSPDRINEFLYESTLDDSRLNDWLDRNRARGLVCTHTGLPWIRHLRIQRFAVNCGVVGKPDHDGDPAIHYAWVEPRAGSWEIVIRRVDYDQRSWAEQLAREEVDEIFVEPLRTGWWTTGVNSLPNAERNRSTRSALRQS